MTPKKSVKRINSLGLLTGRSRPRILWSAVETICWNFYAPLGKVSEEVETERRIVSNHVTPINLFQLGPHLKHPLIFYFGLLGECFDRRDSRAFTAFVPEKLPVFQSSNNINSYNQIMRGVLSY